MAKKLPKSKIKKRILLIVKDYLQNVENKIKVKKAILFGSAAAGKIHRDSDIDLIILSPDFKKMEFMERLILLSRLRRGMKQTAPMDVFGYTPEEFEKLSKELIILQEAKREGKIIK